MLTFSQHCCNDDQQSQLENDGNDPPPTFRSETPGNFIIDNEMCPLHQWSLQVQQQCILGPATLSVK